MSPPQEYLWAKVLSSRSNCTVRLTGQNAESRHIRNHNSSDRRMVPNHKQTTPSTKPSLPPPAAKLGTTRLIIIRKWCSRPFLHHYNNNNNNWKGWAATQGVFNYHYHYGITITDPAREEGAGAQAHDHSPHPTASALACKARRSRTWPWTGAWSPEQPWTSCSLSRCKGGSEPRSGAGAAGSTRLGLVGSSAACAADEVASVGAPGLRLHSQEQGCRSWNPVKAGLQIQQRGPLPGSWLATIS